jgi:hypothetical protein
MTVQEPDPPNLRLMVLAVLDLLDDVVDESKYGILPEDTQMRAWALANAVRRFKDAEL